MSKTTDTRPAAASGTFRLGDDLEINRLGYGTMQLTGKGVWGDPKDRDEAVRVLKRSVELGVNFFDTADSYGPEVAENLLHEALPPHTRRRHRHRDEGRPHPPGPRPLDTRRPPRPTSVSRPN
ncbi:aldo/keto reductase [Streptomyces sp. NPDC101776]|uniref:aldo/keto reductase n=1 Tax=Streptomyces sp. NPDC101776 TaxID=3366146 RepID=UPI0037F1845B